MPFLYSVTLRSHTPENPFQFIKLNLLADEQLHALKLANVKALQLNMCVVRIEELEEVRHNPLPAFLFSPKGMEYAL